MNRRQVSKIALRNRPVKAFRQIKSFVNGLISTRIPEELEWVEEHIEEDYAFGMDFPNDGECLPITCAREYSTGRVDSRGSGNLVSSTESLDCVGIDIEATSNANYLQRAHQFREDFSLTTQTWSGSVEFPVRVGPFQPYRSDKSLGNSIIPYVGEATLEFDWRNYQSADSNSDVYKINGIHGSYTAQDQVPANMFVPQPGAFVGQDPAAAVFYPEARAPIAQPRHMDVAKYLFECGGALASSARVSSFGCRGRTEPFCFAVDNGNIDATTTVRGRSFMICPYDTDAVCDWYVGDRQVGFSINGAQNNIPGNNHSITGDGSRQTCGVKTGFKDFAAVKTAFPNDTLVNFDQDWLIENTELTSAHLPAKFVVGSTDFRDFSALRDGGAFDGGHRQNSGAFGQAIPHGTVHAWTSQFAAITGASQARVNVGSANFNKRCTRISADPALVIDLRTFRGRQFQLANALGLPSTKVYFKPNGMGVALDNQITHQNRHDNPHVRYLVWEVYDPDRLKAQAVVHAKAQFAGGGYVNGMEPVQRLAYELSKKNYEKDQIISAWIPHPTTEGHLKALDNMNVGGTAVNEQGFNGGNAPRGHRPLYANLDTDVLTATYNADPYARALRTSTFETEVIMGNAAARQAFFGALVINIEKASGVNCFAYLSITNFGTGPGTGVGSYDHTDFFIPWGTRLRLKEFAHVGITHSVQCLGAALADPQKYVAPKRLLAPDNNTDNVCFDFDWEEQRGRFPYQVIQPRFDGFQGINTASGQGKTGFIYEDAIKNIQLSWRQQPELVCEWVILPRSKVQATYRLAYPQHQFFRCLFPSPKFTLPSRRTEHKVAIRGLQLNAVPNKVYVYCMLTEGSRNYLEWLDCKPTITNIETTINETVDTTSHIPLWLGFRFFKENCPYSQKTLDEWKCDNMWVLSPQQLNVTPETYTESMARVNTLSMTCTVRMNRAYKQISSNYSPALFAGLATTAKTVMTPEFEMRVVVVYDNTSIIINSKNEMMIEKNTLASRGPTGLIREDRGLPRQSGLMMY